MIRGMYAAATGLLAYSQQQEVLAENLAQSSTNGYRQKGVIFETFDRVLGRDVPPAGDIVGTHIAGTYTDFSPGSFQHTNQPYDLALDKDSFFILNGPRGPVYTRNGTFHRDVQGVLVSEAGYPLQGTAGVIRVPPSTLRFEVAYDGTVQADGNTIGQIQRARFNNPGELVSVGPTLFRAPPGSGLQFSTARVLQGYRETSNIQPPQAMIQMLQGMQFFDAASRALRTIAETIALNTKPQ